MYKKAPVKPEIRLSIFVDASLLLRAKVAAAKRNIPVYRLVSEALADFLKKKAVANEG